MRAAGHMVSEYVASDKLADSQRRVGGRHSMSEYAPSDRLTASIACKDFSFRVPLIWVCPPQEARIFYKICRHE